MSDIYLQITETPTVVTLSAPVVSGALASTVTVANTVTVALDSNSLSALENVTVTVGAAITGTVTVSNFPATQPVSIASVTIGNTVTIAGTVTANPTGTQTIAGTVTANVPDLALVVGENQNTPNPAHGIQIGYISDISGTFVNVSDNTSGYQQLPIKGAVTANLGSALPAGTNRIGVVTIGAGTVTIGAGTAQIGSVTVSNISSLPDGDSNPVIRTFMFGYDYVNDEPVAIANNGTSLSVAGTVQLGASLPAGTAQIGSVTASISNSVVTFYPMQGTTLTNSNFTSTTASTTLVSAVAGREVLTVFNEGPSNLFISPGATCTTISYQVRLSSGDYWECPQGQLSLAHTAVFATSGTARVTEVS